jgi:hypothetical protein
MAYQTGTATSQEDLMNILQTFAAANGWTVDIMSTTNDWMAMNNGSVYVQFRWDNSTGIAFFHSRGFINTSTAPGNHTDDDGCGTVDATAPYNATVSTGRRLNIGNGPYTAYHFFTDGTTKYIHVALEYSPGQFRHFSVGSVNKIGNWIGGEYCVTSFIGSNAHIINSSTHDFLWSGVASGSTTADANECGSMHVESFPNQTVGQGKWQLFSNQSASLGNDRQSTPRPRIASPGGMFSHNPWLNSFGPFRASLLNGFLPLIPIPVWWKDLTPAPDQLMLLGFVPDVHLMQMANLTPGQEFVIGADTFKVFPALKKSSVGSGEESQNCGIVYRKVT